MSGPVHLGRPLRNGRGLDVFGSVRSIFASRRGALWTAFLFTGVINCFMLATPLYSLQVFSTVVPTGSIETLVSLTLMAAGAMIVMSALELIRDRILHKAGLWLDFNLAGYVLERWLRLGPGQGVDIRTEAKLVLGHSRLFDRAGDPAAV